MRPIVANFFVSLDGVVEDPSQWHFPYWDDDMGRVMTEGLATQTAFILGRRGYDEWSQYWPTASVDEPFAAHINGLPKYVLTHRPIEGELWQNTTVLGADPVAELRAIKAEGTGQIALSGSATTVRWLIGAGLLDELHLLVHPILVGKGQRLFESESTAPLTLESNTALASGVLHLRYSVAR